MVSCVVPYVDRAFNAAPNVGKAGAIIFTVGLLVETYLRSNAYSQEYLGTNYWFCKDSFNVLWKIRVTKAIQHGFFLPLAPYKAAILGCIYLGLMQSQDSKWRGWIFGRTIDTTVVEIDADRPTLFSIIASVLELRNISAKVAGSLATAVVVQRALTGETTGKISVIVATALLSLSCWNVKNLVTSQMVS